MRARMPVTVKGSCTSPSSAPWVGANLSPTERRRVVATVLPSTPPKNSLAWKLRPAANVKGRPSPRVSRSK